MRSPVRPVAALAVIVLLAAGCSRAAPSGSQASPANSSAAAASVPGGASAAGDFGTLDNVCHGGSAGGLTDQGVTSSSIEVGVLTDVGFTKDPQLENAARAFTAWCNGAGGIDGRKLAADIHDTKLLAVVSAMTSACARDFVLAGGSAALDGLSVATRLKCLLPDFDEQPTMAENAGSGLQISPVTFNYAYSGYAGYYKWLLSTYPGSANHVGVVYGLSVITEVDAKMVAQTVKADGGSVTADVTYPETGVTDWTPYAEAIKDKGIQHNYAPLDGVYPVEKAAANPAVAKIVQLLKQYAPGQPVTLEVLQAFSAWLSFAVSAETCGADLTRKCVYEAALKQTSWTGGGVTAPVDLATPLAAPNCYDIEQATSAGWQPAPFDPNDGVYRCGEPAVGLGPGYPAPTQLSTVGETLADLK